MSRPVVSWEIKLWFCVVPVMLPAYQRTFLDGERDMLLNLKRYVVLSSSRWYDPDTFWQENTLEALFSGSPDCCLSLTVFLGAVVELSCVEGV